MLREFCQWLGATAPSQTIQNVSWIIPTVQTVHIISIAIVMTSIVMLDLRLLGIAGRRQSVADTAHRFLPWAWVALILLACSGGLLIMSDPGRELLSQVFWLKMSLLSIAVVLTGSFQWMLRRGSEFWERHRTTAAVIAIVSLGLWISILTAGRWIAYAGHT